MEDWNAGMIHAGFGIAFWTSVSLECNKRGIYLVCIRKEYPLKGNQLTALQPLLQHGVDKVTAAKGMENCIRINKTLCFYNSRNCN